MPNPQPPPVAQPPPVPGQRRTVSLDDLVTTRTEAGPPRCSILYLGFEKSGKSNYIFSWTKAGKMVVIQTDPNKGVLDAHPDVPVIDLHAIAEAEGKAAAWNYLEDTVLPAIKNRELDCETVAIDSDVYLYEMMQAAIPMPTASGGKQDTFKYWDTVKKKAYQLHNTLISATSPFPGQPDRRTYHVVVACHLQELTNDSGGVIGFRPGLQGSFKNEVGRLFKTVLFCDTERDVQPKGGGEPAEVKVRYVCHTRPPNQWVKCGDSFAAPGGKYKPLPDRVDGSYEGLMKAWGLTEESK